MNQLMLKAQFIVGRLEEQQPRLAPIYYILIGTFLTSLNSLLAKYVGIPATQIVYGRSIVMIICNFFVCDNLSIKMYGFQKEIQKKLFMRGIFGCAATTLFYIGVKRVSISEGQVLIQTSPFWTSLIAAFILRSQKLTLRFIMNLLFCFIGIILIAQPPFLFKIFGSVSDKNSTELMGVVAILLSSFLFSIIQILINNLSEQVNQLVIPQYFAAVSIPICCLTILIDTSTPWVILDTKQFIYMFLLGIVVYLQQIFVNRAFIKGDLTEISMLGQTQMIYGYLFDVIMGADISILSISGTALIIFSLIRVIQDKRKKK